MRPGQRQNVVTTGECEQQYLLEGHIHAHVGNVLGGGLDKKCNYDIGVMGAYQ